MYNFFKLFTSIKVVQIDETEVKSNYNTQTQQINITVRSPDTRFLAEAAPQVSTLLL
ncbi:hypothetical protein [Coleofasciculus chthonoplastes]|uniref:hypothetical protein n=1 Tax=Coleofasciculus chthonoplastes TaxID=64178 RepID=UPI00330373C2